MRLIARLPDQTQASGLVDSLRNLGFDRKDMIVNDLADEQEFNSKAEASENVAFIKTERDGLGEISAFAEGIKGLKGETGIVVAVEIPKHSAAKVREAMEQSGAIEIIRD